MKHPAKHIAKALSILLAGTLFLTSCSPLTPIGLLEYLLADEEEDEEHTGTAIPNMIEITDGTGDSTYTIPSNVTESLFDTGAVREPQVKLKGNGEDTVTILVYMNGSNLESEDAEATTDLTEMVRAGSSDKVNILVQTMGTRSWNRLFGIASNRSQIYSVDGNGLTLVRDDLGQLDCTREQTLTDFLTWGTANYPADRFILLFWDHGGGPVYGFGYDQWVEDEYAALTIDEIQSALKTSGTYFDFIGMDCCIMSCLEVTCALYDYCDYMILSEDFESGLGWYYTDWLRALMENTSTSTYDLAKIAIDSMIRANEQNYDGSDSILALIDESVMKVLFTAWTEFAYANKDALLDQNYSTQVISSGRTLPKLGLGTFGSWGGYADYYDSYDYEDDYDQVYMSDYYITDIMAVAQNIDSAESNALAAALNSAVLYMRSTKGDSHLTGLSVTLPYGNPDFCEEMSGIFRNCGFDRKYISFLQEFAEVDTGYYDYSDWDEDWSGWEDYDEDYDWTMFDYLLDGILDSYTYDWSED